ncbi:MAG: YhgE/Pip domain-containing protein, partial [Lachnospiraceae bacterium]|nr:YhgE/Pip domain-containing protein [Lachnospiraceae bacterium]
MKDYEKMYEELSEVSRQQHEKNQKRIRTGIKLLFLIPTIFLALLFLTGSNKVVFLILWILSLFILAFYLITVEYFDYQMQKTTQKWAGEDEAGDEETENLIGQDIERMSAQVRAQVRNMPAPVKKLFPNLRKIGWVFIQDAKRHSSNVVAVVVIIGLTLLPSLYAWFNIFSNWDPYGPSATGNIPIAVYSLDQGSSIGSLSLNVGDSVVEGLKANNTIGWVFTDSEEETVQGIYNGKYYAALIIPADFTEQLIGFVEDGAVKQPKIIYYENDKKNAIAPKITQKAQKAVQEQINASFVSTITDKVMSGSEVLAWRDDDDKTILENVIVELENVDSSIRTYEVILSTFISLMDATDQLVETTQALFPGLEDLNQQSVNSIYAVGDALDYAGKMGDSTGDIVHTGVTASVNALKTVRAGLMQDQMDLSAALEHYDEKIDEYLNIVQKVEALVSTLSARGDIFGVDVKGLLSPVEQSLALMEEKLQGGKGIQSAEDLKALILELVNLIDITTGQITDMESALQEKTSTVYDKAMADADKAMDLAVDALKTLSGDSDRIVSKLEELQSTLGEGKDALKQSRDILVSVDTKLTKAIDELNKVLQDSRYQELVRVLEEEPESLGEFISSPVKLETVEIYAIENYGSAMAPFYTTLALWVGALILVAIIHVKVETPEGMKINYVHKYFGRYITFFLISQAQNLIAVLGDLFFI